MASRVVLGAASLTGHGTLTATAPRKLTRRQLEEELLLLLL